jgi:enoyl-[acyl-carrier protein] reductase I
VRGRFTGKSALILGVANRRSLGWAVAERLAGEGARVALTFRRDRAEEVVRKLAESIHAAYLGPCDVRSESDLEQLFADVAHQFAGRLDILVHSVAFAAKEDLEGRFVDTPRDRFWLALDVSAYSLVAAARAAEPLMDDAGGGSIVTMTYLGGKRALPHYNVMGVAKAALDSTVQYLAWDLGRKNIRVNAVSPGPVRTLAARAVPGFTTLETTNEVRSPLHKPISASDVAGATVYLLSDDASKITGTILYVDCGYHAMGI